jgi:hypothetical protein
MKQILISSIIADNDVQIRVKTNANYVQRLKSDIENGVDIDPIIVYLDQNQYILSDGFHRLEAMKLAGHDNISVELREGDRRAAILNSIITNSKHGRALNNADKRKAVSKMLKDSEWSRFSDRKIAGYCGVSHTFVSNIRREISGNGCQWPEKREGADGREYPIGEDGKKIPYKGTRYYLNQIKKKKEMITTLDNKISVIEKKKDRLNEEINDIHELIRLYG